MSETEIIILAAGKGKRMGGDGPKALTILKGKSFLLRLVDSVKKIFTHKKPVIVVGYQKELVIEHLGPGYRYAHQSEQLGTGHAVLVAKEQIDPTAKSVLVLYADHPLLSPDTIRGIVSAHSDSSATLTMATVRLPHWNDWYKEAFFSYGRILRDGKGNITGIVECKDANQDELALTEVNPAYFCFDQEWLWNEIANIKNENAQREYYLTDLVRRAFETGEKIATVTISPEEGLGANTKEQLDFLGRFAKE